MPTTRARVTALAGAHPCPACGGTGIAGAPARSPQGRGRGLTTDEVMADATAKMLDLARQYAAEG